MKILYYQTNHKADGRCISAMRELGAQIELFSCPLQEEEQEQRFVPLIRQMLKEQQADAIYSFGYFPALSEVCKEEGRLYISYCCDVPALTMFSKNAANPCNRILLADSAAVGEFRAKGVKETYYLPLAPVLWREGKPTGEDGRGLIFAGSLHQKNMYQHFAKLPDLIRGYLDGITAAQVHVYGYSLFADFMQEAFWDTIMQELFAEGMADDREKHKYIIEHFFLDQQTTWLERSRILKQLAGLYPEEFCLYTRDACDLPNVRCGGFVPYGDKLAALYQESSIVLNITNRARRSGVPQNAWDILGCGGFLLSNFQADFEGLLEPGKDFVVYGSVQELIDIIEYYWNHPKERQEIARNGQKKVQMEHTWRERAGAILSLL